MLRSVGREGRVAIVFGIMFSIFLQAERLLRRGSHGSRILRCCEIDWMMSLCVVRVRIMWLQTCIQKGVWGAKAWEMVLASRISTSSLMMGRLIPPFLSEREDMSILGWYFLPFQTNWLTRVCSWVIMEWGGGETDAWYQNRERMCVLSTSTLPLRVRFRLAMDAALSLAFWSREFQRVVVFSGVMGRRTPRVARGREAAGG